MAARGTLHITQMIGRQKLSAMLGRAPFKEAVLGGPRVSGFESGSGGRIVWHARKSKQTTFDAHTSNSTLTFQNKVGILPDHRGSVLGKLEGPI